MSDLISRQAAISVVGFARGDSPSITREDWNAIIEALEALPSAQPSYTDEQIQKMQELEQAEIEKAFQLGMEDVLSEIVRCKDCRWWDRMEDSKNGYCHAAKHGHYSKHWEIRIYRTYKEDFFCANAERREDG